MALSFDFVGFVQAAFVLSLSLQPQNDDAACELFCCNCTLHDANITVIAMSGFLTNTVRDAHCTLDTHG